MLHLPTPMLMGAQQGKTYADFVAHINGLTTGRASWVQLAQQTTVTQASGPASGDMLGSPWLGPYARNSSRISRVVQHGLPSESELLEQIAAGRHLYVEVNTGGFDQSFQSVSRNGYMSISSAEGTDQVAYVQRILYWSGDRACQTQPRLGLGPTPYDWSA